jgi:hypothetical protein
VAVDQIKLSSVFERFGDVKIFGDFGIDVRVLFISILHHGAQVSAGHRISGGEQCHVPTTSD